MLRANIYEFFVDQFGGPNEFYGNWLYMFW